MDSLSISWIDKMGIPLAFNFKELKRIPGSRNGNLAKQQRLCWLCFPASRPDRDSPTRPSGRRSTNRYVASSFYHRAFYSSRPQYQEGLIDDVALGNSTQVDSHAALGQRHGSVVAAEGEVLEPGAAKGIRDPVGRWQVAAANGPLPKSGQGTCGDIEGSLR